MWMGRRSWLDGCIYFYINHNCQHISGCALLIEELSLPISQLVGVETGIRQGEPDSIRKVLSTLIMFGNG